MAKHTIDDIIINFRRSTQKKKFAGADKVFFFKELSYLIKGGVSIRDAIKTINQSTENMILEEITNYLFIKIDEGKPLTYALSRLPSYFTPGDVAIIKSGEESGRLVDVLLSLANEYTFLRKIKNQYVGAMVYPVIMLLVSSIAIIALFVFILPGLFGLVNQFDGASIPPVTKFLMGLSSFLTEQGILLLIIVTIIGMIAGVVGSTKGGQRWLMQLVLEMPVFGSMTKSYYLIKFSRYMKLMLRAGLGYRNLFQLQKQILNVPFYQEMIDDVLYGLERGDGIFERMSNHTNIIPADVLVLLKVGEETATLKESLQNIIEMYSEDLEAKIGTISKVIEPVMIVFVGGVIGLIALSVFGIIGNVLDALPTF